MITYEQVCKLIELGKNNITYVENDDSDIYVCKYEGFTVTAGYGTWSKIYKAVLKDDNIPLDLVLYDSERRNIFKKMENYMAVKDKTDKIESEIRLNALLTGKNWEEEYRQKNVDEFEDKYL